MTFRVVARTAEHLLDLGPDHRNPGHRLGIGRRGQQTQKAVLTGDPALVVDSPDADVVQITGPVHAGPLVVLGDHHQRFVVLPVSPVAAPTQRDRVEGLLGGRVRTQDAEAGAGHRGHQPRLALGTARIRSTRSRTARCRTARSRTAQVVAAIAEEGEVVVAQPAQQFGGVAHLRRVDRGRVLLQRGHDLDRPLTHRVPVGDGILDVADHLAQPVGQIPGALRTLLVLRRRGDLQMHPRLGQHAGIPLGLVGGQHPLQPARIVAVDVELGVKDLVQAPALAGHLHGHRVDQERVIVGHDLDHGGTVGAPAHGRSGTGRPAIIGVGRGLARVMTLGVEDADRRLTGFPFQGKPEVALDQAQQVLDAAFVDVGGVDVAEVVVEEGRDHLRILADLSGDRRTPRRDHLDLVRLLPFGLCLEHAHALIPIWSTRLDVVAIRALP